MSRDQQHRAIAFLVEAIRSEGPGEQWSTPGILAALDKLRDRPLADVAVAAIRATARTDQRTPAVIAMGGEHWATGKQPTPTPPTVRSADICQGCTKERAIHDEINRKVPESAHEWLSLAEVQSRATRHLGIA